MRDTKERKAIQALKRLGSKGFVIGKMALPVVRRWAEELDRGGQKHLDLLHINSAAQSRLNISEKEAQKLLASVLTVLNPSLLP